MKAIAAIVAGVVALAGAAPGLAQPVRPPDQRQWLVDLAYVLGETHALRTACRGASDQTWRARMTRLVEVEQPDEPFHRRLIDSFNAGFVSRQAEHPTCSAATGAAEREAAARGRSLAERLAAAR